MRVTKKVHIAPEGAQQEQDESVEGGGKLHLVDAKKEEMAVACIEYFKDIYGVCTSLPEMCVCE